MSILNGIKLKDDETVHQLDWENGVGNKPFYVEKGEDIELLPNQELTFEIQDGEGQCLLENVIELVDGQTYKVIYDDVEYVCVCRYIEQQLSEEEYMKMWALGNLEAIGEEDNGIPFVIATANESGGFATLVLSGDENPTHTVGLYQGGEIVHQLDSKFVNAYTKEESYSRKEIDTMLGTYVNEVDALLGGSE